MTFPSQIANESAGSTGAAGVTFFLEPEIPDDPMVIPGAAGATGATGATGITIYIEPELPEDPLVIPGTSSSSSSAKRTVGITFDGAGAVPTVGTIGYLVCQFSGTINRWDIVSDASGSAVVDVWKTPSAIPTVANTIAGTEKPTLAGAQLNSDTALSTWTTAVTAGDVFGFKLDSVTTCTRITVEVRIAES